MTKCQYCDSTRHGTIECPQRSSKLLGKRMREECDECGEAGHTAPDCPYTGPVDAGECEGEADDAQSDEDDAKTHVSKCGVCEADQDVECTTAGGGGGECPYADDRR